jgi:hypothetical protein
MHAHNLHPLSEVWTVLIRLKFGVKHLFHKNKEYPQTIAESWQGSIEQFKEHRNAYLIYSDQ